MNDYCNRIAYATGCVKEWRIKRKGEMKNE